MKLNFFQRSVRPAKTDSPSTDKARGKQADASPSSSNLVAKNPPVRFSELKSAKSGGGKSVSSSAILRRLPSAIAKPLSQREASVVDTPKGASSSSIPSSRLASKADNLSSAAVAQPMPEHEAADLQRQPQAWSGQSLPRPMHTAEGAERGGQSLIGSARRHSGAVDDGRLESRSPRTEAGAPRDPAPLSAEQDAGLDALIANLGLSSPRESARARLFREAQADFDAMLATANPADDALQSELAALRAIGDGGAEAYKANLAALESFGKSGAVGSLESSLAALERLKRGDA